MTNEDFRAELLASVHSRAETLLMGTREAFAAELGERLRDAGELPDLEPCQESLTGQRNRRLEIDGFAYDEADDSLHLVACILDGSEAASKITLSDARAEAFNRLEGVFEQSRSGWLVENIEESRPLWELARRIQKSSLPAALRLHLFTDRVISERVRVIEIGATSEGVPIDFQIWDASRLRRIHEAQSARDDLIVDLSGLPGGGLPVLPATVSDDYRAYLAVIPGYALADIFIRHGSRLLEGNVRTFLGRGGNVNKGIASTLAKEASRFFAYNNGLAATAASVTLGTGEHGGPVITEATDLQIVNGAQTTSSLAALRREKKLPEEGVYVPVKLSVVDALVSEELVPRISKFANSQNAVKASDFFANHPFHRRIQDLSRRILAPSQAGSQVQTHWFYERSRGQYLNEQAGFTKAKREQFVRSYPRAQLITKTELAKIETCFEQLPDVACKGAEKAFVAFADRISRAWADESQRATYSDDWFRSSMARVILFRTAERLVGAASWYASGTRAQVVAHSTAKLANIAAQLSGGGQLDYLKVWSRQDAGDVLTEQLHLIAETVWSVLQSPDREGMNVGEWAKQQACRNRVFQAEVEVAHGLDAWLMSKAEQRSERRAERESQRITDGLEVVTEAMKLGPYYWANVRDLARKHHISSEVEDRALASLASASARVPNQQQAGRAVAVRDRLRTEGIALPL